MIARYTPWSRAILTDAQKAAIAAAQPGRDAIRISGQGPRGPWDAIVTRTVPHPRGGTTTVEVARERSTDAWDAVQRALASGVEAKP